MVIIVMLLLALSLLMACRRFVVVFVIRPTVGFNVDLGYLVENCINTGNFRDGQKVVAKGVKSSARALGKVY